MSNQSSFRGRLAFGLGVSSMLLTGGALGQASPPDQGPGCFPRCRTGFTCVEDRCVVPVLPTAPAVFAPPAPTPRVDSAPKTIDFTLEDAERARFNGGRLVVEILVSGVGGAAAGYATFKGVCGREPCIGGFLGAATVELVGMPLLAYGTGEMMGGRGSLLTTYGLGLLGFTATAPLAEKNPGLALSISFGLIPILAPLAYELSSGAQSREMKKTLGVAELSPTIAPLFHGASMVGGAIGVAGTM